MSHKYLLYIAIVLLLPLQFGLHMAILNAPMDNMGCLVDGGHKDCIAGWEPALPSSIYAIGGLIGSAITTLLTKNLGLDGSLCSAALLFQIGTVVFRLARTQSTVIISRAIAGIGAGIAIVGAPLAINILAPPHLRAFFGAQTQISTNLGIILAQFWGVLWAEPHWRRIVTASVGISSFALAGTVYLLVTQRLRSKSTEIVTAEYQPSSSHTTLPSVSVKRLLSSPQYRRLLVVCIAIFTAQQLTGINAIILYGTRTLAKVFPSYSKQVNLIVSLVNLVMTLVGAVFINKFGRKRLLVISLSLTGLFTSVLALAMNHEWQGFTAMAVIMTIASFAIGIGPIPFLYVSEISPGEAVDAAQSVGTVSSWLATFAVVAVFPSLQAGWGASSFYIFGLLTVASAVTGSFYLLPDPSSSSHA